MEQTKKIQESLSLIKNKIIVMSGKGGVGKSSVAVNLAVSLAKRGFKTGLMDVDLHGPSVPKMTGLTDSVYVDNAGKILPLEYSENLKVISIESALDDIESAVIWRGPMKTSAINQFLSDVEWGELDYLVIDAPPGTGDEPLTVVQTIKDVKALIVTTPQDVALRDVRKSIDFCNKLNIKIVGILENMSAFVCPGCGLETAIFKKHGGNKIAEELKLKLLGNIPIMPEIVDYSDNGIPSVEKSEKLLNIFNKVITNIIE